MTLDEDVQIYLEPREGVCNLGEDCNRGEKYLCISKGEVCEHFSLSCYFKHAVRGNIGEREMCVSNELKRWRPYDQ